MTNEGMKQLREDEGLRLLPYKCTAGKLTVGYGHNLEVPMSKRVADYILAEDVAAAENDVWNLLSEGPLMTFARWDVVVNMRFNLGPTRFRLFKNMLAALNYGEWSIAADEMKDSLWFTQVGDRAKRLVNVMRCGE